MEFRVARAIDLAHAARTDRRGDLVDAEAGTGGEGQTLVVDYTGRMPARTGLRLSDGRVYSSWVGVLGGSENGLGLLAAPRLFASILNGDQ